MDKSLIEHSYQEINGTVIACFWGSDPNIYLRRGQQIEKMYMLYIEFNTHCSLMQKQSERKYKKWQLLWLLLWPLVDSCQILFPWFSSMQKQKNNSHYNSFASYLADERILNKSYFCFVKFTNYSIKVIGVFPKCFQWIMVKGLKPAAISCVRDQDVTTAPARHIYVKDRIFKFSPIHASLIYLIPWICWIQWIQ